MRRQKLKFERLKPVVMVVLGVVMALAGVVGVDGELSVRAEELIAESKLGEVVVTAVNVGKNTIKLKYRADNKQKRAEKIREIVIFVMRDRFGMNYQEIFCAGSDINRKEFFKDCRAEESEWQKRLLKGEEVEIAGNPGFLQNNYRGNIYYNLVFEKGGEAASQSGSARYLQCLQWPEYAEGQECRRELVMTKAGMRATYRPYKNGKKVVVDEVERSEWNNQGEFKQNKFGRLIVTELNPEFYLKAKYVGDGIVRDIKVFYTKSARKDLKEAAEQRILYWQKMQGKYPEILNAGGEERLDYNLKDLRASPTGIVYIETEIEHRGEVWKNLMMVNFGSCVGVEDYGAIGGTEVCMRMERGEERKVEYWRKLNGDYDGRKVADLSKLMFFEQEELRARDEEEWKKQEAARLKAEAEQKRKLKEQALADEVKNLRQAMEAQAKIVTKLMQEVEVGKLARQELIKMKAERTREIMRLEKMIREEEMKRLEERMMGKLALIRDEMQKEVQKTRKLTEGEIFRLGQEVRGALLASNKRFDQGLRSVDEMMVGILKTATEKGLVNEDGGKTEGQEGLSAKQGDNEREGNIPVPITGEKKEVNENIDGEANVKMVMIVSGVVIGMILVMAVTIIIIRTRRKNEI